MVTAVNMSSLQLFEGTSHAAAYAMLRPTYPKIVFNTISTLNMVVLGLMLQ